MGKLFMTRGLLLLLGGAVVYFGEKNLNLGRLPGDIHIERENFRFHFPIVTSMVVSVILTIVLNLFWGRR